MKNRITLVGGVTAGVLIAISASLIAGPITLPNTFSSGTPAKASEVNGNFTAVKSAVDDNAARIVTLESNAANPNVSGNVTLPPSTATVGNILKGTAPFIHNFGTDNTFIGLSAGNFTMTGVANTASGERALANITDGESNTASGYEALANNTTGGHNTASGASALLANTTGGDNTASGRSALRNNTTGSDNTAIGRSALFSNATGESNTASGRAALLSNTGGSNNTASGANALASNTIGTANTAIGVNALFRNTQGSNNIAIGFEAGLLLTTGTANIMIGNAGLSSDTSTIKIGTAQARTFIAGIRGVTTANANAVNVVIDSVGQLGTANSSRRVKDHIGDMGTASDMLMKLRPVTFYYKSDKNPSGRTLQYGLIAEEVAATAPELVARSANGEIETVYYQFLAPMLLNEFQQQQRTIQAQTARIAALEKQGAELAELMRSKSPTPQLISSN